MSNSRMPQFIVNSVPPSFAAVAASHLRGELNSAQAENARLHTLLAKKNDTEDQDKDPPPDDDDAEPSDIDGPKGPPKSKKKARDKNDDETQEPGTPDDRAPEPVEASTLFRAAIGRPLIASANRIFSDVQRRVTEVPQGSALSLDTYQRSVAASAALVIQAGAEARGEVAAPIAPNAGTQPGFTGQESTDPRYWRAVNASARTVLEAHYARHGKKFGE